MGSKVRNFCLESLLMKACFWHLFSNKQINIQMTEIPRDYNKYKCLQLTSLAVCIPAGYIRPELFASNFALVEWQVEK